MNRRDSQIDTIGGHGSSLPVRVQKSNPQHEAARADGRCEASCGFKEHKIVSQHDIVAHGIT